MISKANSNKHKSLTQQHIKLPSQAQVLYKPPLTYPSFPIPELKASVEVPSIPQGQTQERSNRRYKFNAPIQPNFKFNSQNVNSEFIMPARTQQIVNVNRPEPLPIQVII